MSKKIKVVHTITTMVDTNTSDIHAAAEMFVLYYDGYKIAEDYKRTAVVDPRSVTEDIVSSETITKTYATVADLTKAGWDFISADQLALLTTLTT
jgi:uncharacterized membrane protein